MNELKTEIPLLSLELPKSGYVVSFNSYLTTGQSRDLQGILLSGSRFSAEQGKVEDVPVATFLKMQDRAAEFLIKQVKNKEGAVLETDVSILNWLYELPVEDGNLVYEKINEITGASALAAEAKKK